MTNYNRIGDLKDEYIPDIEDKRLFGSSLAERYILPLKRNDRWTTAVRLTGYRNLSPSAWKRLGIILGTNKHIRYLAIKECVVGVSGLCEGLKKNRSIKGLCLKHADLQEEAVINSLAPFLSRLKTITLQFCNIGPRVSKALGVIAGKSKHIRDFTLATCVIDMAELCDGLQKNQSIEKLIFGMVDLASGIKSLANFLSHGRCLKKIALQSCNIDPPIVNALSDALSSRSCDTAIELDLRGRGVDVSFDDGHLDYSLHPFFRSKQLSRLHRQENHISWRGWTSIANLLMSNKSHLRALKLDFNSIYAYNGVLLLEALSTNDKLETLSIIGNPDCTREKDFWSAMLCLVYDTSSVKGLISSNHTLCDLTVSRPVEMNETLGVDDGDLLRASLKINATSHKALVARRKILWAVVRGELELRDITDVEDMLAVKRCLEDDAIIQNDDPLPPQRNIDLARVSLDFIFAFFQKHGGVQHLQS